MSDLDVPDVSVHPGRLHPAALVIVINHYDLDHAATVTMARD